MSVTFSREALSLAPLVIGGSPTVTVPLWVPEDGVSVPEFPVRMSMAPDSAYIPGGLPLAITLGPDPNWPLTVYAQAQGSHTLAQAKALLVAAFQQWAYEVTLDISGDPTTYPAYMATAAWGPVDSGMTAAGIARCNLSIFVNPPGA